MISSLRQIYWTLPIKKGVGTLKLANGRFKLFDCLLSGQIARLLYFNFLSYCSKSIDYAYS